MHDEQINQRPSTTPEPEAALAFDQRLLRTLETAPELHIPADFATRVAQRVPARRPISLTRTYYGHYAIQISAVVLLTALLALALDTTRHSTFGSTLQILLSVQFIALTVWLGLIRPRVN